MGISYDIGRTQITCAIFAAHSNLPTQVSIGEGPYARYLNETTPYYDGLISMLKVAHNRPSIPEYPEIADNIRQAIEQVYNGTRNQNKHWMTLQHLRRSLDGKRSRIMNILKLGLCHVILPCNRISLWI